MKNNVHIGRYFGIPIKVHWSFGILVLFLVYLSSSNSLSAKEITVFIIGLLSIFTFVLVHELGHAYAARKVNVTVKDIILTPIGGLARLDNIYKNPYNELVIAIGGPAINLMLALFFLAVVYFFGEDNFLDFNSIVSFNTSDGISMLFFRINFVLFAFNLLPAFPMDGGRIFRAILRFKFSRKKATYIASYLAKTIAIIFVLIAIRFQFYILILLGIIVFFMANKELKTELES